MEASALLSIATTQGGFGAILHKGDPERGALQLVVAERGEPKCVLERLLERDGSYRWAMRTMTDSAQLRQYVARASANDPDLWVVELDVPSAERFIAEMT
jgi:hypothetical protein